LAEATAAIRPHLADAGAPQLAEPLGFLLAAQALGHGAMVEYLAPRLLDHTRAVIAALVRLAARARGQGRSLVRVDAHGVPEEMLEVDRLQELATAEDAPADLRMIALYDRGVEGARAHDGAAMAAFARELDAVSDADAALLAGLAIASAAIYMGQTWSSGAVLEAP
jgi:hypothetical protein